MSETAVIYARLSDVREKGDTDGIERQVREARAHADRLGVDVVEVLIDNDLSAAKKRRRPDFEQLMTGIAESRWNVMLTRSLDRWVRRPAELERIIDVVEKSTVRVEAIHGVIDLRTPQGRLQARMLTAVAMHEVETVTQRVNDWHTDRAARGMPLNGQPGYGYRRAKGSDVVTIADEEATRIRDAAERIIAGESLLAITREWNEAAVPGPGGGRWRPGALRRILLAPRVVGLRVHNGETARGTWDPILDDDVWHRVGEVLTRPERRKSPANRNAKLLTGIASCGPCGNTLNQKRNHGVRRYFCRHCFGIMVFAERLEEHVVADLCATLDTMTIDEQPDREALAAMVLDLEAQLDELADDAGAGRIELREWKIARLGVTARLDAVRAQLTATSGREVVWVGHGDRLAAAWDNMTVAEQRRVLTTWITDIRVDPAVVGRNRFDPTRVAISYRR